MYLEIRNTIAGIRTYAEIHQRKKNPRDSLEMVETIAW